MLLHYWSGLRKHHRGDTFRLDEHSNECLNDLSEVKLLDMVGDDDHIPYNCRAVGKNRKIKPIAKYQKRFPAAPKLKFNRTSLDKKKHRKSPSALKMLYSKSKTIIKSPQPYTRQAKVKTERMTAPHHAKGGRRVKK